MKPAIIAIGYNRAKALKRLLESLNNAIYETDDIKLIISIDHSKKEKDEKNQAVLNFANSFEWKHGEKQVIFREKNMGLRAHVLACGDLVNEYESIIMLEDDIFVAPMFYKYACNALSFVCEKDYIAGVSLYNEKINFQTEELFYPIEDGYDNWYFKFPQSWGQAWTKKQWNEFRKWYDDNNEKSLVSDDMPSAVSSWPQTSWKKYFAKYVIENNKYFIYPKCSFTTNSGDTGVNHAEYNLTFQVPMQMNLKREFNFSDIKESNSIYDQFMENEKLGYLFDEYGKNLTVDLYGHKPIPTKGYFLTIKQLDFKVLKTFGCCQIPRELNIINNIEGNVFYLYDVEMKQKNPYKVSNIPISYNFKGLNIWTEYGIAKRFVKHFFQILKDKVVKK